MTAAYAYLRVSHPNQAAEDRDGYPRQLAAVEEYAAAHGFEIVEVFREHITGTTELSDRPALSELFAALSENGVKTIIIEKLDRLARDVVVQELLIRDIMRHDYVLLSTLEPDICSNDPTRKFIRQIFGAVAGYEKEMIVLKLRGARQRMKAKTGRCEGGKPFGELPGEAGTLALIFQFHSEGLNSDKISERLNEYKRDTRSGQPWRGSTIRKILSRENSGKRT